MLEFHELLDAQSLVERSGTLPSLDKQDLQHGATLFFVVFDQLFYFLEVAGMCDQTLTNFVHYQPRLNPIHQKRHHSPVGRIQSWVQAASSDEHCLC